MAETMTEMQFAETVRATLARHPDWLRSTLDAVTLGMNAAVEAARADAGQANISMLAALTLASPERLTANSRLTMNEVVMRSFAGPEHRCAAERLFAARTRGED